jgi:uncharacterized membrane protein YphA (DoxX/SURF4 family)
MLFVCDFQKAFNYRLRNARMDWNRYFPYALLCLRLTIAGLLIYFGILAVVDPAWELGWMALWVQELPLIGTATFIFAFGILQIIVGLALAVGFYVRYAALATAGMLFGIVVNLGVDEVAARDLGLLFAALVVATAKEHKWTLRA